MTGKRSVRTDVINDTEGRALTESVDIMKRWEEYCGKLYKNQDGDNDNNRLDQRCDYDREPPPLRSEAYMSTQREVMEGQTGRHRAKRANFGRGVGGSSPGN